MPKFNSGFQLLICLLFFVCASCSSSQRRADNYKDIELGMRKRDVLDLAGNPRFTDRKKGIDRWYYYLEPERPSSIREVHFRDNIVIYKGKRIQPDLTVEEEEAVRAPKPKPYIKSMSDEELKGLIKKELKKEKKKKKKPRYEKI